MSAAESHPEQQAGKWQQTWWGQPVEGLLPLSVYRPVNYITNSENPDTLLLCGWGADKEVIEKAVNYLGQKGLHVAGVETNYPPINKDTIVEDDTNAFLAGAFSAIIHQINKHAGRPVDTKMDIMGISGGAGEALIVALLNPELIGSVGALNPPGLNNEYMGREISNRRKEFLSRFQTALGRLGLEELPRFEPGYKQRLLYTLSLPREFAVTVLKTLVERGHSVRIFSGEKDDLFKFEEIKTVLDEFGLSDMLQSVKGNHVLLKTFEGLERIKEVGEWIISAGKD